MIKNKCKKNYVFSHFKHLFDLRNYIYNFNIWVLVPWPCIKYIIRGKVVASPMSRSWWVLWVRVCLWLVHVGRCSKPALINFLFSLCRSMSMIELLVNLPSPIPELQHALLPPKCYELGSAPQLFLLPLSSLLGSQLSPSRSLVRQLNPHTYDLFAIDYLLLILLIAYLINWLHNLPN